MSDEALLHALGFDGAAHVATGGAARVFRHGAHALKVVDETLASTLKEEARLLRLIGPPATPAVHAEHHRVLVLEWLEGLTLQQWLGGQHTPEERRQLAIALSRALGALHARGVIHRDVKASNVMHTREGPRWFDFGLAIEATATTSVAARQGTRTTMAPEAWSGAAPSTRTDVYSLGVLLFEVLTGRPPFTGDAAALEFAHRQERAPAAALGVELDAVLARCLEKDPSARFGDANEVANALVHADSSLTTNAGPAAAATSEGERLTALLALPPTLSVKELTPKFGAIGAVWVGASMFAHPHPLGPAHGLAQFDALARELSPDFTLHVAPLKVRVRSLSVRVSGEALERTEWISSAPGRSLTPAASPHFSLERESTGPVESESAWLEDGTRLPPIEAALKSNGPTLVWVKAPSGSGRTRLLRELAMRLRSTGDGEAWLVDDAERLGWQQWEWLEDLTAPGHATPTDVVVVGDERLSSLRPHLGSRAAHFTVVTPSLLSDDEARRLVRAQLTAAELVPEVLVRELADAAGGLAGTITETIQVLKQRGLLARDVHTGEWRLSSDVRGLRATARLGSAALNELPGALHDLARLLALATWPLDVDELDRALRALPEAFGARRLDAGAALAQLSAHGLGALVRGRFAWLRHGVQRALAAETGPRIAELHRALASVAATELREHTQRVSTSFAMEAPHREHQHARPAGEQRAETSVAATRPVEHAGAEQRAETSVAATRPVEHAGAEQRAETSGVAALRPVEHAGAEQRAETSGVAALRPVEHAGAEQRAETSGVAALRPGEHAQARAQGTQTSDAEFRREHLRLSAELEAVLSRVTSERRARPARAAQPGRAITQLVEAVAHHAHAAGWTELATVASADAGLAALRAGDAIGCDMLLTRALLVPSGRLLLARARARRQLERFSDAIADARAVTGALELCIAARLEASLSLDWMNEFAKANEESERALADGAAFEAMPSPLGRELRLARGRLHVRAGRWHEAIEVLAPLCEHAPAHDEVETILGAHALAASVCCVLGDLARGERLFAAGLALAERHGQPVVGCALLINRPMLWMGLGRVEDALADLRAAATISRRLGHAQIERVASHNLAQYLLWLGRLDEAHALAARAGQLAT
ncbi:MAG: serine/threonine protein kinase, partial [Archangium sp.]|nr:serine/threonine protein kinase [Archangium sp.]